MKSLNPLMKKNKKVYEKYVFKVSVRNRLLPYLFIAPALLAIVVIVIFPILYSLRISFYNWNFRTDVDRIFIGFNNYIEIFHDSLFFNSLRVTIIYVISAITIELFAGFSLALILNSPKIKGMRYISSILLTPMIIAPVAIGISFRMVLNPTRGIVNMLLHYITRMPIEHMPIWLGDVRIVFLSIILIDVWMGTPFFMLLILSGLRGLPIEPYEAAKVDGASNWQCFRHLTLRYLKPILIIALMFRIVDTFREFDKIYVMTQGGPGHITENFVIRIFKTAFLDYRLGYAAAMGIILVILTGIIAWSLIKSIRIEN